MYFSMDEIGLENAEKILTVTSEAGRWRFIYDTAKQYGFGGIHFTPSLYQTFNLDTANIPAYFTDFKLTYHVGGMRDILSAAYDDEMDKAFKIAADRGMHDISIHPPGSKPSAAEKNTAIDYFTKTVDKWLNIAVKRGISFSLETHVAGKYFLFDGFSEYVKFIGKFPELGVLIDISHNYYEPQYSEDEIIAALSHQNVKGLHISDALRTAHFKAGTHLPVGDGEVDFAKLLYGFKHFTDLYGALEVKSDNEGITRSLNNLYSY
jgi:sugar phosphate isomerase/epimerase